MHRVTWSFPEYVFTDKVFSFVRYNFFYTSISWSIKQPHLLKIFFLFCLFHICKLEMWPLHSKSREWFLFLFRATSVFTMHSIFLALTSTGDRSLFNLYNKNSSNGTLETIRLHFFIITVLVTFTLQRLWYCVENYKCLDLKPLILIHVVYKWEINW